MLQKYFPILGEVNSPLAAMAALGFTASAAEIALSGVSNETLETLLKEAIEGTAVYKKEVEVSISELKEARKEAAKELKAARYRAAWAARSARKISKVGRQLKAVRRPVAGKASLRNLSGLSIETCRSRAVVAQSAVRVAAAQFNTAHEAVMIAIEKGGDVRVIRSKVAALKEAVRTLEVRHLEFRFAKEMLAISLARHSA